MPNTLQLKEIVRLVRETVFPEFHAERGKDALPERMTQLYYVLKKQIENGLHFFAEQTDDGCQDKCSEVLTKAFLERLPELKRLLYTDVQAMYDGDPAAQFCGEVIICYPSIQAMTHYRTAHELLKLGIPVIPRIITELAHSQTGIDIHPGAQIGEYFCIDHGTGVVIGETCIIGNHVRLYQGVTLGARSFTLDERGNPVNVPRHPIIEDNVIVYSNSTILGRITIGHDSVIGGNVWLTNSVPPHSRIVQQKASGHGEKQ